jgi:hypothetical protein
MWMPMAAKGKMASYVAIARYHHAKKNYSDGVDASHPWVLKGKMGHVLIMLMSVIFYSITWALEETEHTVTF